MQLIKWIDISASSSHFKIKKNNNNNRIVKIGCLEVFDAANNWISLFRVWSDANEITQTNTNTKGPYIYASGKERRGIKFSCVFVCVERECMLRCRSSRKANAHCSVLYTLYILFIGHCSLLIAYSIDCVHCSQQHFGCFRECLWMYTEVQSSQNIARQENAARWYGKREKVRCSVLVSSRESVREWIYFVYFQIWLKLYVVLGRKRLFTSQCSYIDEYMLWEAHCCAAAPHSLHR